MAAQHSPRGKLQSELEEFRQHWLVSLAQIMPSQDRSLAVISSNAESTRTTASSSRARDELERLEGTYHFAEFSQPCSRTESREEQEDSIERIRVDEVAHSKCDMSSPQTTANVVGNSRIRKVVTERILTKRRRRGSTEEDLVGRLISDIVGFAACQSTVRAGISDRHVVDWYRMK